jgi:uncharacterized damage-inducible protein DinB
MRPIDRLLKQLEMNFNGEPWYGSPLRKLLAECGDEKAHQHPVEGARSPAELFAHLIAWNELVTRRLRGEVFEVTPEMDFPSAEGVTWSELVARFDSAYAALLETVRGIDDVDQLVAGKKHTIEYTINGLLHHNTYHAAQIALLKK